MGDPGKPGKDDCRNEVPIRPGPCVVEVVSEEVHGSPLGLLVLEHLLQRHVEDSRDLKSDLERRRILAQLDRVDRLTRHADAIGQFLLRHLGLVEAQVADGVSNSAAAHCQTSRRNRTIWLPNLTSSAMTIEKSTNCDNVQTFTGKCRVKIERSAPPNRT